MEISDGDRSIVHPLQTDAWFAETNPHQGNTLPGRLFDYQSSIDARRSADGLPCNRSISDPENGIRCPDPPGKVGHS